MGGSPAKSLDHNWPSSVCVNHLKEASTVQRSMATQVVEVTEYNFEVSFDLQGHLEAAMASEGTKT